MWLMIVGLLIWTAAHLLRSCAQNLRQSLQDKFGSASKGIIAAIIIVSLVLIVIGYRGSDTILLWSPPLWLRYINNLLMFLALYVFFITATKPNAAFLFSGLRHPQLTGFKIWAIAHLIVNGDLASVVLFGGLLAWAVSQVIVSKRAESLVDRSSAPISSPWIHLALVVAVFLGITITHNWLGAYPLAR